jgi:hypothetical protein
MDSRQLVRNDDAMFVRELKGDLWNVERSLWRLGSV